MRPTTPSVRIVPNYSKSNPNSDDSDEGIQDIEREANNFEDEGVEFPTNWLHGIDDMIDVNEYNYFVGLANKELKIYAT